ncbi:MAG TPA: VanZ family protein [Thermoanaerobaculales bacterium]|nr:VanZ family protein [Thermoanaerobaculales bacterium]
MGGTDHGRAPQRRTSRAAVAAAAWAALLYAGIPLVRPVQQRLLGSLGPGWIIATVLGAVAAALVVAAILVRRSPRPTTSFDLVWLAAIAALAAAAAWQLRGRPEEAVHLVQFGVLAVLIYRSLRPPEPDVAVLAAVVLLGSLVGTVDEIIQWIVPGRFWDLRDVAVNAAACALVAAALWRLDPGPWRRPPPSSLSLALRLAAALILLLALCLANTPGRVAWYAGRVPGLGLLARADNAMTEYGHRHRLPGIGEMKSRLTMAELAAQDRERAAEVAAVLDRYPEGRYGRFLEDHGEAADPFLYEARIHLFSRDAHFRQFRDAAPGSAAAPEHATIAFREQQLLERVFANTLARSRFGLDPQRRRSLEQAHDPERPFVSSSASHLITGVGERPLRIALLAAAAALLALDAAVRRRMRMEASP